METVKSGTETELTAAILQSSHITAVNSVSVPDFTVPLSRPDKPLVHPTPH